MARLDLCSRLDISRRSTYSEQHPEKLAYLCSRTFHCLLQFLLCQNPS
nr:MAG TPA: hypothetical protein [Caudoviricetes sp.]DAV34967.1 MAG TPA: hypothetical protein [Caudoviricetes sp.]